MGVISFAARLALLSLVFVPTPRVKKQFYILDAILTTPISGVIELSLDWSRKSCPNLSLKGPTPGFESLVPVGPEEFAQTSGYCRTDDGQMLFVLPADYLEAQGMTEIPIYVAGSFNDWPNAVGQETWALSPSELYGRCCWVCECDLKILEADEARQFKFVTSDHQWLSVPSDAEGSVLDGAGNRNLRVDLDRTGRHRFAFELKSPLDLSEHYEANLNFGSEISRRTLRPGPFFHRIRSDLPMGALVEPSSAGDRSVFRLFAPRAKWVRVGLFEDIDLAVDITWYPLDRLDDGAWEAVIPGNHRGWYYWFRLDGPQNEYGHFDPTRNILDPYARATVGREGPGIVLDLDQIHCSSQTFRTPQWQDMVVVESHIRDLLAEAPILMDDSARLGFSGLTEWVDHSGFYLKRLGVNAVELQPVQEFDNESTEYHWGYMPVNYFSPESSYGSDPSQGLQVSELVELVEAFHRNGITVLLDVVYNHVGLPNHLLYIDKLYYFELGQDASLMSWSGCGNDVRCSAAMMRRLIFDSLLHLVEFYGVDGFRFDLAELIGIEVLRELEAALRAAKPDVVLIAEPWSLRGHSAGELRDTGYSSWNDGYRNFLRDYVRGVGLAETAAYYLRGSPWYFARWPAQTLNYVESHDDRTWIDVITENKSGDGSDPTVVDIQRTHIMIAFLMASLGIPMLHAGQDFLGTKKGEHNTYQKRELNALDYRRIFRFSGTHNYFSEWIRFRLSPWGALIRLYSPPSDDYFSVHHLDQGSGIAIVYNADGSLGPRRLLFAINPEQNETRLPLDRWSDCAWRQLADQGRFDIEGIAPLFPIDRTVFLPAIGCGLWVVEVE